MPKVMARAAISAPVAGPSSWRHPGFARAGEARAAMTLEADLSVSTRSSSWTCRMRLNCIQHLLTQVPYTEVPHDPITLPDRVHSPDYARTPISKQMYVPSVF